MPHSDIVIIGGGAIGLSSAYYLNKKGGLNKNADKKSIYILHPNGETLKVPFNKNIFMKQGSEVNIYAGSIIFIPRKLNSNIASRLTAQAYASILGDLGISLASISILKD